MNGTGMNATSMKVPDARSDRQRLPAVAALVLFVALCASIAYWALQWLAPPPRAVAAPVASERVMPPVSAAANLFGGAAKSGSMMNVQLRGIIHAGRSTGSAAIMTVDGSPPRFYRVNAELIPGVTVKAIHARTVVLSDRGAERELPLPAFAAQEAGGGAPLRALPDQGLPQNLPPQPAPAFQPQPAPQPVQPQNQLQRQGQLQGQPQNQPLAPQSQTALPQANQGATPSAGPSALGSTSAGAEPPQETGRRATRNLRRPRYQSD